MNHRNATKSQTMPAVSSCHSSLAPVLVINLLSIAGKFFCGVVVLAQAELFRQLMRSEFVADAARNASAA
jgi:hypothetical protein